MRCVFGGALFSLALILAPAGVWGSEVSGRFGVLADIHFEPSDPGALPGVSPAGPADGSAKLAPIRQNPAPRRGRDTDEVLLSSALSAVADRMASADFVIVAGDLLGHGFGGEADASAPGKGTRQDAAQGWAGFVIGALAKALPGKPILISLGNNDSDCGDYAITPGGDFLAATMATVRAAVGAGHLTQDFETTYLAGGYYEARHPTVQNARILVLNDVLWSSDYRNICGATGLEESRKQMEWLKARFAASRARGSVVWLVHHMPWGIDAYSTLHAQAGTCSSGVIPFLRDDVARELYPLLRQHAGMIAASFSAHSHFDDFRLIQDHAGKPVIADKMVPAISPLFGQDPAFLLFTYDAARGTPVDYTSYHLSNLDALSPSVPGEWREQYVFSRLYSREGYSPESVSRLPKELGEAGPARELYFEQRTGLSSEADFNTYACAVAHAERDDYAHCRCPPAP